MNHNTRTDNGSFQRWNNSNILEQSNESKFYSERNSEQIYVMECWLSFGAGSFVFQFAIQIYKEQETEFCLLFCMGVKFGRSHRGRNVG
jgi:hypothetical protein